MTIYKYEMSVRNCGMSCDRWLCTVRDSDVDHDRQMGLAISYSSTVKLLYTVSSVASDLICSIGHSWVSKTASFHIVYDNLNQY